VLCVANARILNDETFADHAELLVAAALRGNLGCLYRPHSKCPWGVDRRCAAGGIHVSPRALGWLDSKRSI